MWMLFDPYYLLFVALPMMALLGLCQLWVKSAYNKYSQVRSSSGISGADAARGILRASGVDDVTVEMTQGFLSDHYDPKNRVLRLSPGNYNGRSIAAVGIAAHEVGHAIQHANHYAPLVIRNAAVPVASFGSSFGWIAIIGGFFLSALAPVLGNALILLGVGGIGAIAVFQLINLPVEFDASRRALQVLPEMGILTPDENAHARKVLNAAAMTYVAATIGAILVLLYWLWRLGLLGGQE